MSANMTVQNCVSERVNNSYSLVSVVYFAVLEKTGRGLYQLSSRLAKLQELINIPLIEEEYIGNSYFPAYKEAKLLGHFS